MAKITKTDAQWRDQLSEEEYRVLRGKGTEIPFSGEHVLKTKDGMYTCTACGAELFSTDDQHESVTPGLVGWPSFSKAADNKAIELKPDNSGGMVRTEVVCANCGSHLGHLFDDANTPGDQHFCINSVCLKLKPKE